MENGGLMQINNYSLSDLAVGRSESIEVSVKPEDIDAFAKLSGDYSPIHMDADFAKKKGFGGKVSHGLYIGALISRLIGNRLPGSNGILQSIDLGFRKPLVPPKKIKVQGIVGHISESTGQITIDVTVTDSDGQLIATAKAKSIVKN